jgi:succinyl-diaminopimelate desuccinylase
VPDVVALTQELIRIPSPNPPWDERKIAEHVLAFLLDHGIDAELIGVEAPDSAHANVFGRVAGRGNKAPFVLCGHLDTVPAGADAWSRPPYEPSIESGRLFGLGGTDMKGGVAAMCVAAAQIAAQAKAGNPPAGDLLLAFTSGEETGSRGAKAFAESGRLDGATGMLIGEPTENRVGIAEKGGLWLDVIVHGRTAHGSLPHLGANAISGLAEILTALESATIEGRAANAPALSDAQQRLRDAVLRPPHPLLGAPTLTPTRSNGGVATNVVPDHAMAIFDIRTLPGQDGTAIQQAVTDVAVEVAERRGLRAEVISRGERVALETPEDHWLVTECAAAVEEVTGKPAEHCALTGATDATELVPALRIPFVICGPGIMAQAHHPNEYVSIDALQEAVQVYVALVKRLLA